MKKSFTIDKGVYLVNHGNYYDLHNNYHFYKCVIIPNEATIILNWLRLDREWVQKSEPPEIVINFQNASFFSISDNILNDHIVQIQEMGYKEPDDKDLNWLNNENYFSMSSHIIFRFENDEFIRIHSEYATVKDGNIS